MFSPPEAESAIAASIPRLRTRDVPLVELVGRVLRQPVRLTRDQPPYDRVAMDGIAFATRLLTNSAIPMHMRALRRVRVISFRCSAPTALWNCPPKTARTSQAR